MTSFSPKATFDTVSKIYIYVYVYVCVCIYLYVHTQDGSETFTGNLFETKRNHADTKVSDSQILVTLVPWAPARS